MTALWRKALLWTKFAISTSNKTYVKRNKSFRCKCDIHYNVPWWHKLLHSSHSFYISKWHFLKCLDVITTSWQSHQLPPLIFEMEDISNFVLDLDILLCNCNNSKIDELRLLRSSIYRYVLNWSEVHQHSLSISIEWKNTHENSVKYMMHKTQTSWLISNWCYWPGQVHWHDLHSNHSINLVGFFNKE